MTSRPVRIAAGTIADARRAASFCGTGYYRFARRATARLKLQIQLA
jgi:hypothetical protein